MDECRKKNRTNEQMQRVMMSTLSPIRMVDALKDGLRIEEKSSSRPGVGESKRFSVSLCVFLRAFSWIKIQSIIDGK